MQINFAVNCSADQPASLFSFALQIVQYLFFFENFKLKASSGHFVLDLVRNPKDQFSCDVSTNSNVINRIPNNTFFFSLRCAMEISNLKM